MTLEEVLHAHIPTLRTDACMRDAVDRMDLYQFSALVVVDEDKMPVGLVTEADLCDSLGAAEDLVEWSRRPILGGASRAPSLAAPSDDALLALKRMFMEQCEMLVVVHDARLAGVVTKIDLMQALLANQDTGSWPNQESIG